MIHWRTKELSADMTAAELSHRLHRSDDAVRSAARRHGVALKPKPRGWPAERRTKALELVAKGSSIAASARTVRVPESTVRLWVLNADQAVAA